MIEVVQMYNVATTTARICIMTIVKVWRAKDASFKQQVGWPRVGLERRVSKGPLFKVKVDNQSDKTCPKLYVGEANHAESSLSAIKSD